MCYWSLFISLCIVLVLSASVLWYIIRNKIKSVIFWVSAAMSAISLLFVSYIAVDIPNVLSGGEKVYVSEFPTVIKYDYMNLVAADERLLLSFIKYNPDKYKKDTKYCVQYTKQTGILIDIKKVD